MKLFIKVNSDTTNLYYYEFQDMQQGIHSSQGIMFWVQNV